MASYAFGCFLGRLTFMGKGKTATRPSVTQTAGRITKGREELSVLWVEEAFRHS